MVHQEGKKGATNLNIVRATSISQAYTPTTNEDFIINTLDKLINEERYSECPNHQKVNFPFFDYFSDPNLGGKLQQSQNCTQKLCHFWQYFQLDEKCTANSSWGRARLHRREQWWI